MYPLAIYLPQDKTSKHKNIIIFLFSCKLFVINKSGAAMKGQVALLGYTSFQEFNSFTS